MIGKRKIIRKKRPDYEEYLESVPHYKPKRKHHHDCNYKY